MSRTPHFYQVLLRPFPALTQWLHLVVPRIFVCALLILCAAVSVIPCLSYHLLLSEELGSLSEGRTPPYATVL